MPVLVVIAVIACNVQGLILFSAKQVSDKPQGLFEFFYKLLFISITRVLIGFAFTLIDIAFLPNI